MKDYCVQQFKSELWLPISSTQAWEFFSSPINLSRITPPEMDFKILTKEVSEKIYNGMKIDYSVKPLFGIKMKWKTEIVNVSNEKYFTDIQLRGPYKMWVHIHYFEKQNGGILMTDIVNYQLPFGAFGVLLHKLFIRSRIENIFNYRKSILIKILSSD